MAKFGDKLMHAWNAFTGQQNTLYSYGDYGASYGMRPYGVSLGVSNEKNIVSTIYNQISVDVAAVDVHHVRLDDDDRYVGKIKSGLNECLTLEANIDQTARAFMQDVVLTMFDKGVIAIVPVDTTLNPKQTAGYDIKSMRVGEIVQWHPKHVRVLLYNEKTGKKEEVTLAKDFVSIVENPLYQVMNEPNSTLQRLRRKLSLLDSIDEQVGSGKLDLIIQLPYVIKSESRKQQAEQRRKDIEVQLKGSQYGIAYTDGTENITQLNRPVENNMLKQVEYLSNMLYNQLGLTAEVFNGTADEKTMVNYFNRTIEPILKAITQSMERTFLTKTARSQGQAIRFYRDPFRLASLADIAELADKLTRNEIMSSNEIRSKIAMKPVQDQKADELRNKNLPAVDEPAPPPKTQKPEGDLQNGT